jgi:type II secretory pathway pseudopilin PulG
MRATRQKLKGQKGYVLLAVMLFVTLLIIALAVAAPQIGQQIKREREEELIHRGQEYSTAIKKFYRANNGQYPVSLDQLANSNNRRFLRKRYKDPITGKDDWKLIHVGEAILNLNPNTSQSGSSDPNNSSQNGNNQDNTGKTGGAGQNNPPGGQGTPGPIGGGQIIGVSSISKQKSIKEIKGKDHYDEWQFVYDPRLDRPGGQGIINTTTNPPGGNGPPPK